MCFNTTYHAPLQESQEVKILLSDINRPANINMIVRPTNSGIYTLKDHAMYGIRNVDARLQEVQATIAKSSYVLPPHLRGLTKLPTGKHAEIFGWG